MSFRAWFRPGNDPQEPASPPPFAPADRVVVSPRAIDGMFLGGHHGTVEQVDFTTDPDNPFGPWVVKVLLDGQSETMSFHAAELTRETQDPEPPEAVKVTITQPEDDDFTADAPIPYVLSYTQVGPEREQLSPQVSSDPGAKIEWAFANKVEADLAELTQRGRQS